MQNNTLPMLQNNNAAITSGKHMTADRLRKAVEDLLKYKSGKNSLESRLIANEQWWKQRHWETLANEHTANQPMYTSAWLFNVVASKHADAMQAYPTANILPRQEDDKAEAQKLSDIIPVVLEQNDFEAVYDAVQWQKGKGGTGVYGIFWDNTKHGGLGDIAIRKMSLLNVFWEPGISDIQKSRQIFVTEYVDEDALRDEHPELGNSQLGDMLTPAKFLNEDNVTHEGQVVVVNWYYKKRRKLHFCKFVGEHVLYASEDDEQLAERGWYDHGLYPFVFDVLFPVEDSPCGFGYVDICKDAQEQVDLLNRAVVTNAITGATPRYFIRVDGSVNEQEYADFTNSFVHVDGMLGQDSIMPIETKPLAGNYVDVANGKVQEMKEVSGTTDASQGISSSGVTAASAIAALQEASGKLSRDSTKAAYRSYCLIIEQVIELMRQFYDVPRMYRITGQHGEDRFVAFDNRGIQPQMQRDSLGVESGLRKPVFDIKISAQQKTVYSQNSQNELAIQLYQLGVFAPQNVDQALMLLETMDFDGKEDIVQRVAQQGAMYQQLQMWQQMALALAQKYEPNMAQDLAQQAVAMGQMPQPGAAPEQLQGIRGLTAEDKPDEHARVEKARAQSRAASQPEGGGV